MTTAQAHLQEFYSTQSQITDPGEHADLFQGLPQDLPTLCHIVQGLIIHIGLLKLYGVDASKERESEADIRDVAPMLARIRELDPRPLAVARPPEKRLVGHCRVSAVLLCSMLRAQSIPARVRFGFSRYYAPGFYGDHELCEYWHPTEERWVLVDQELDDPELNEILT